jgi:hypothetical protein
MRQNFHGTELTWQLDLNWKLATKLQVRQNTKNSHPHLLSQTRKVYFYHNEWNLDGLHLRSGKTQTKNQDHFNG